ncbi:MAG: PD-(D/E)XK nuclease family protein, partial [Myxococcota bacterium]
MLGRIGGAGEWARAIAGLPVEGPLPERVVLVPRERVAHALRRALIEMGRPELLIGTRFMGPLAAAEEVLGEAGSSLHGGEEGLRTLRLRRLFREGLPLSSFDLAQLRGRAGWDAAFASTITELEAAGHRPETLPDEAPFGDLALLWRTLDDAAGESATRPRLFAEAAAILERDPSRWPFGGPVLAAVTGLEEATHARFVRAIPGVRLALHTARPRRHLYVERVRAAYGDELAEVAEREADGDATRWPHIPGSEATPARSEAPRRGVSRGVPPRGGLRVGVGGSDETKGSEATPARSEAPRRGVSRGVPPRGGLRVGVGGSDETNQTTPAAATRGSPREIDLLHRYFLAAPDQLAHPDRPRSAGPDGSVHLEEHSGVDEEIEAAATWVTREVLEHGTPLEDIAILVPTADPWLALVTQRLRQIPWPGEGDLPVCVAEGLPFASTDAGTRVLTVLRALEGYLDAGSMERLLPLLKTTDDAPRMDPGDALELAWSLGTAGGSRAHPEQASVWADRARAHRAALAEALAADDAEPDDGDAGRARDRRSLARRAALLESLEPALDALVEVARKLVGDAPLPEVWKAVKAFLETHVKLRVQGPPAPTLMHDALAPLLASPLAASVTGEDALAAIVDAVGSLRVRPVRYGTPAVYVGTVAGAGGLSFRAVRTIGLCEGALPSVPQEDPVLPDSARAKLGPATPTSAHRVIGQLHALSRAVAQTTERLVLSAPRLSPERTQREPSSVLLEAGVALARPGPDGTRPPVPKRKVLARDYLAPARAALADFERAH